MSKKKHATRVRKNVPICSTCGRELGPLPELVEQHNKVCKDKREPVFPFRRISALPQSAPVSRSDVRFVGVGTPESLGGAK